MTPDMIWVKNRTDNGTGHYVFDTVRGDNQNLRPDDNYTQAAVNGASHGIVSTIGYNSFTVKDGGSSGNNVGSTGTDNYVAWHWKAGGNKNTFNVDDVGYANASDVNMNVGAQNSSIYDTSDTWSDDLSSPNGSYGGSSVTSAFNGSLTNGFEAGNPSGNHSTIRFQPASPITVNTQIRIHVFDLNDSNVTYQWRVNDGSWNNMPGTSSPYRRWQDLSFTGSLTSFEYRSNTSITYKPTLYAVEIDGKLLIDTGTDLSGLTQYPSIASSGCSVGTKQGFSIIKYDGGGTAGDTISHGLLQTPEFVVVKDTEDSDNWQIYHAGAQTSGALLLKFTNDSATSNNGPWNNTAPTSSLITLGGGGTNDSGNSHICYAWHSVPGLQKFGSFTGNGSQNFVSLDFRPALVWVKRVVVNSSPDSGTSHSAWTIMDSKRLSYNGLTPNHLYANHNASEGKRGNASGTSGLTDMTLEPLSNGFYLNGPGTEVNANTGTYIYCAWAEAPAFNLYGGQSNAR